MNQMSGAQTRLYFLFKILENRSAFADPDYIITVCDEIKDIMTIREEETKKETKE